MAKNFLSYPVVKTPPSTTGGMASIPGKQTRIPYATKCGQKFTYIHTQIMAKVTEMYSEKSVSSTHTHTHTHTHTLNYP